MTDVKNSKAAKAFAYLILICATICCIAPLLVIISASLSSETEILKYGYSLLPRGFTLSAYKLIFQTPNTILNAYGTTIFVTVVGTLSSLVVTMLAAYPLSRKDFVWRNKFNLYFYFTMLFSGGMIPSYILITQYLKMQNTLPVLIIPHMFNVWNMFMLRTNLSSIDSALIESAKIEGAGEYQILYHIILPMSKVGLATVGFLICMSYWNDWILCFMYMTNGKYITLQYFLQQTLSNIDAMMKLSAQGGTGAAVDLSDLPSESARMAMCIIAAGPMLFAFMFFQKYFTGGIALGSVKG